MSSNPSRIRFADHRRERVYDVSSPPCLPASRTAQTEEMSLAWGQSPCAAPPAQNTTTVRPQSYQSTPSRTAQTAIWGDAAPPATPLIAPVALPAVPGESQMGHRAVPPHYNQSINFGLPHGAAASPAQETGALPPASVAPPINALGISPLSSNSSPVSSNDTPSPAPVDAIDFHALHAALLTFPLLWNLKRSLTIPSDALWSNDYAFADLAKSCSLRFSAGDDLTETIRVESEHRGQPLQVCDVIKAILQYLWRARDESAILPYHRFYEDALRARTHRRDTAWRSADFWPGTALYFHGLRPVQTSTAGAPVYGVLLSGSPPQGPSAPPRA
ncbi:hypothetical protein FKP32DRAFT_880366 [Trametes sanguinea]|nr:hypothetical protein FKP32DRAFT_880366 [Trametes sanguinea]